MTVRNTVTLIGRLGRDPEEIQTRTDTKMATFSLATNDYRRNAKGETVKTTQWHECVAFGNTAQRLIEFLQKGKEVALSGRINYREYEDKEGRKQRRAQIMVTSFHLTSSPRGEQVQ